MILVQNLTSVSQSSPTTWSTSLGSRPMAKRGKGGVVRSMSTSRVMDTEDGARVFGKEIFVTGSDQNDGVWAGLEASDWEGP